MWIVVEKPRLTKVAMGNKLVVKQQAAISALCNSILGTIARVGEVRREGGMGSCLLSSRSREFRVYSASDDTPSTQTATPLIHTHSDVRLLYLAQREGLH